MAITTTPVVAGELIESAWGNSVRADLLALDTGKIGGNGGTVSTGSLVVGNDPVGTLSPGVRLDIDGRIFSIRNTAGVGNLHLRRRDAAGTAVGQPYADFYRVESPVGSITLASTTSIAYNTTSDPRLKHRTGDVDDAADLVQQLGAVAFRGQWIDPETREPGGDTWVFLSSHDIEDVAPYAVSGERDGTDDDGHIRPQQADYGSLVPLLTAALSQALDRIDDLTARLSALETAT